MGHPIGDEGDMRNFLASFIHARLPTQSRPWGTYFFTVNLLERRSRLLVEHIDPSPGVLLTRGKRRHTAEGACAFSFGRSLRCLTCGAS
jgi:hypothetical protein